MEKGKLIDLGTYRDNKPADDHAFNSAFMSDELKHAIQMLIQRLKEEGPILQPI